MDPNNQSFDENAFSSDNPYDDIDIFTCSYCEEHLCICDYDVELEEYDIVNLGGDPGGFTIVE